MQFSASRDNSDQMKQRQKLLHELNQGTEKYQKMLQNLNEGLTFYADLRKDYIDPLLSVRVIIACGSACTCAFPQYMIMTFLYFVVV